MVSILSYSDHLGALLPPTEKGVPFCHVVKQTFIKAAASGTLGSELPFAAPDTEDSRRKDLAATTYRSRTEVFGARARII